MNKALWSIAHLQKVIPPEKVEGRIFEIKQQKQTIATLNGSFDLLHAGHLQIIYEASRQADLLIVALNSDASIQRYKGSARPIIPLNLRLEMICALEFVSYATWFEESDPRELLSKIKPDVHVNGSEYGKDCIEAGVVAAEGGKIHLVERLPGLSTSQVIKKIVAIDEKEYD
jgi:D-beta-D-heptose 7-phosphate kinase/D-beta-D-heptose 1-phosphate adenosyltransferase